MASIVTDLSEANGWIPEAKSSAVLTKVYAESAAESVARRVTMTSRTMGVPRFAHTGVDVVAEHAVIPLVDATLDEVVLTAIKFANRYAISIEDNRDALVDSITAFKLSWASAFARKLDNAVFATNGAGNGGTRPFDSVYQIAGAGNRISTAGALTYEDLVDTFGALEGGDFNGDLVAVAHPALAMSLRNLKDATGDRVVGDPLGQGVPTIFGTELRFSAGLKVSATATDTPTGNPLLVVGNRNHLILGVRDGVESALSDEARWDTDEIELKMRARRGFVAATADAFRVIEITPTV